MPRVMDMDSLPPEIPQTLWFDRLVEDMGNLTNETHDRMNVDVPNITSTSA